MNKFFLFDGFIPLRNHEGVSTQVEISIKTPPKPRTTFLARRGKGSDRFTQYLVD